MENISTKIKLSIFGLIATSIGVFFFGFIVYEKLIMYPFKILYSAELTRDYHSLLAVISFLIAWKLISSLYFIVLNSLKENGNGIKPIIAYFIASGLIFYTSSVIASNFALAYVYNMP